MRQVTKAEMLEYWDKDLLIEILILPDRILAKKEGQHAAETHATEKVWCDYP